MNHYATKEEQNTEMNMLVDVLATSHECPNVPHKRRTKHRDEYVDVLATSHECPTVPCPIPGPPWMSREGSYSVSRPASANIPRPLHS